MRRDSLPGLSPAVGSPAPNSVASFDFSGVPPVLRTLLLSDGTVTSFLEAYFGEEIKIAVLAHEEVMAGDVAALNVQAGTHLLQRRTTFRGAKSERIYCHALSLIRPELLWPGVADDLIQGRVGIGELLRQKKIETYREILTLSWIAAEDLAVEFGLAEQDPLICRTYRIFVNRAPCLYIVDYYSTASFL